MLLSGRYWILNAQLKIKKKLRNLFVWWNSFGSCEFYHMTWIKMSNFYFFVFFLAVFLAFLAFISVHSFQGVSEFQQFGKCGEFDNFFKNLRTFLISSGPLRAQNLYKSLLVKVWNTMHWTKCNRTDFEFKRWRSSFSSNYTHTFLKLSWSQHLDTPRSSEWVSLTPKNG